MKPCRIMHKYAKLRKIMQRNTKVYKSVQKYVEVCNSIKKYLKKKCKCFQIYGEVFKS